MAEPKNNFRFRFARVSALLIAGFWPVFAIAKNLGTPPISPSEIAKIDALYFHRDQGRNLDLSFKSIQAALKEHPDDPALLWREGRDWVRLGEKPKKPKDQIVFFDKARAALEKSIKIKGDQPDAHYWLGVALGRLGQARGILRSLFLLEPVRREMRETLALDPHYEPAFHVLGEVYLELPRFVGGNLKKAISRFQKARALNPNDLVNLLSLGQAYQRLGDKNKALEVLNAAQAAKIPSDPGEAEDNWKDIRRVIQELSQKD